MASKIRKGLAVAVAVGTGVAIGLKLVCNGASDRRRATTQASAAPSDSILMLGPLLDRLDRIDASMSAVEARLAPLAASVAKLDSNIQQHSEDIETLQVQMSEARQKEADGDVARLAALFAEVKHPLFKGHVVH